jgi:hypothetical protein
MVTIALPPPLGPILVVHHKPTYEVGWGLQRERQAVVTAQTVETELAVGIAMSLFSATSAPHPVASQRSFS